MKALVTGGCGFIGTHLVDELTRIGHQVTVVDIKSEPLAVSRNINASYITADIRETDTIAPHFKDVACVFHLAAESRIQASIDNPSEAASVNVLGTLSVMDCCYKFQVPTFINSSSSSVYGLTSVFPTNEDVKTDCLNPYAATKLAAEEMVRCYVRMGKIRNACNLRYFNVFGENSPVTGPYSLVIGIFLEQLRENKPLTVVGDGSAQRDFVYVKDVVKANILAMGRKQELFGQSYNIGSGRNISILQLAKLLDNNIEFVPKREGEAKTTLADYTKARKDIGWEPATYIEDWLLEQRARIYP